MTVKVGDWVKYQRSCLSWQKPHPIEIGEVTEVFHPLANPYYSVNGIAIWHFEIIEVLQHAQGVKEPCRHQWVSDQHGVEYCELCFAQ